MTHYDQDDLEAVEIAAWRSIFEATPERIRRELGMAVERVGAATVFRASGIDHVLFNRTLGLRARDAEELVPPIAERYERAGVGRYFLQIPEGESTLALHQELERGGLTRYHRCWVKLVRGAEPPAHVPTDLSIVRASPSRRSEVAHILEAAFDLPPQARPVMANVVGLEGWHVYVAIDGETVAAAGGLFVHGRAANIAFAATRPDYRRRGAQGALMERRIRTGLELGCRVMTSETGEAVPGDPQHSFGNMRRHDLRPAYRRENWCPTGTTWGRAVA